MNKEFDYNAYYEWARKQTNIFMSEYSMPSDFKEIWSIKKKVLLSQTNGGVGHKKTERIFVSPNDFYRF